MFSVILGNKLYIHLSQGELEQCFSNEVFFEHYLRVIDTMAYESGTEKIEIFLHERSTKLC